MGPRHRAVSLAEGDPGVPALVAGRGRTPSKAGSSPSASEGGSHSLAGRSSRVGRAGTLALSGLLPPRGPHAEKDPPPPARAALPGRQPRAPRGDLCPPGHMSTLSLSLVTGTQGAGKEGSGIHFLVP